MKKVVLQAKRTLSLVLAGLMVLTAVPAKTVNAEEIAVAEEVIADDVVVDEVAEDVIEEAVIADEIAEEAIVVENVADEAAEETIDDDSELDNTGEYGVSVSINALSDAYDTDAFKVTSIKIAESETVEVPEEEGKTVTAIDNRVKAVKDATIKVVVKYDSKLTEDADGNKVDSYKIPKLVVTGSAKTAIKDYPYAILVDRTDSECDLENGVAVYTLKFDKNLNEAGKDLKVDVHATVADKPVTLNISGDENVKEWGVATTQGASPVMGTKAAYDDCTVNDTNAYYYLYVNPKTSLSSGKKYMIDKVMVGDYALEEVKSNAPYPTGTKVFQIATGKTGDNAYDDAKDRIFKDADIKITTTEYAQVTVSVNAADFEGFMGVSVNEAKFNGKDITVSTNEAKNTFYVAKDSNPTLSFKYNKLYSVDVSFNGVELSPADDVYTASELQGEDKENKFVINATRNDKMEEVYFFVSDNNATDITVDDTKLDFKEVITAKIDSVPFKYVATLPLEKGQHSITYGFNEPIDKVAKWVTTISDNTAVNVDCEATLNLSAVSGNETAFNVVDGTDENVVVVYTEADKAKLVVDAEIANGIEEISYKDGEESAKFTKVAEKETASSDTLDKLIKKGTEYNVYRYGSETYPIIDGKIYAKSFETIGGKKLPKYFKADLVNTTTKVEEAVSAEGLESYLFVAYTDKTSINDVAIKLNADYAAVDNAITYVKCVSDNAIKANDDGVYKFIDLVAGAENIVSINVAPRHYVAVDVPAECPGEVTYTVNSSTKPYTGKVFIEDTDDVAFTVPANPKKIRLYVDAVDGANYIDLDIYGNPDKNTVDISKITEISDDTHTIASLDERKTDYTLSLVAQELVPVTLEGIEVSDITSKFISARVYSMALPKNAANNYYYNLSDALFKADDNTLLLAEGDMVVLAAKTDIAKPVNFAATKFEGKSLPVGPKFVKHDGGAETIFKDVKDGYWSVPACNDPKKDEVIAGEETLHYFTVPASASTLSVATKVNEAKAYKVKFVAEGASKYIVDDILSVEDSKSILNDEINTKATLLDLDDPFSFVVKTKYDSDISVSHNGLISVNYVSGNDTYKVSKNSPAADPEVEYTVYVTPTPKSTKTVQFAYNAAAVKVVVKDGSEEITATPGGIVPSEIKSQIKNDVYNYVVPEGANLSVSIAPKTGYSKLSVSVNEYDKDDKGKFPTTPSYINISEDGANLLVTADNDKVFAISEVLTSYVELTDAAGEKTDITSATTLEFDYATAYTITNKVDKANTNVTISGFEFTADDGTTIPAQTDSSKGTIKIDLKKAVAGKSGTLKFTSKYNNETVDHVYTVKIKDEIKEISIPGLTDGAITMEAGTKRTFALTPVPATAGIGGITFVAKAASDSTIATIENPDNDGNIVINALPKASSTGDKVATYNVKKGTDVIGTIKITVTTPVLPVPVVKASAIDTEITVGAVVDDSILADYDNIDVKYTVEYLYKKTGSTTFTSVSKNNVTDKSKFGEVTVDSYTITDLEPVKSYEVKAVLRKMTSNNSTELAKAESAVVTIATKEEAIEYNLKVKKIQNNVYAQKHTAMMGGYEFENVAIAKAVFNDNITDLVIKDAVVYEDGDVSKKVKAIISGNTIKVSALQPLNDYERFNPYSYDAGDFKTYDVVVTADVTTKVDTKKVKAATASFSFDVVKGGEPLDVRYTYPRYVKADGKALEIAAPKATIEGKKVTAKFSKFTVDPVKYEKYITVDTTGKITVDAALKFEDNDTEIIVEPIFDIVENENYIDEKVSVVIANKSIAEQVAWVAVAEVNEQGTAWVVVNPNKLTVNSPYFVIAGNSSTDKPAVGTVIPFDSDALIYDVYAVSNKYYSAATNTTTSVAGKSTIKLATADGSKLAKAVSSVKIKSSYKALGTATLAYDYDDAYDQVVGRILPGKAETVDVTPSQFVTLKLIPDDVNTTDVNVSVKVSNAKVISKYNKTTGEVKVIIKNVKKPIVVKVKDLATKKAKTLTFKLNNSNKATKKAKSIKQVTKSVVYAGDYKNGQTLVLSAKSYAGKTLMLSPDYTVWAKDKTGKYEQFVRALDMEQTADVDATDKTASFKVGSYVAAGTYKAFVTVLDESGKALTKPTQVKITVKKAPAVKSDISFASSVTMSTTGVESERAHVQFTGKDINFAKVTNIYCTNTNGKVNNFTTYFNVANEPGGFYIYVETGWLSKIDAKDLNGLVEVEFSAGKDVYGNDLPTQTKLLPITIVKSN